MQFSDRILTEVVWFLDYDGSLCPHLEVWEERQYDAGEIFESVSNLKRKSKDVFWNTGRRTSSLFGVYEEFAQLSGFFVQGSLRYDAASQVTTRVGPALPQSVIDQYLSLADSHPDFRLEIKETSLRLAVRKNEKLDELLLLLDENPLKTEASAWNWVRGQRGVELLAKGFDKGSPVRSYMKANPTALPIAVGDDVFDVPAIVAAIEAGGWAFLVGDHCGWITQIPHRADQIKFFETPKDLLEWSARL